MPIAGIIEKFEALLADVRDIAKHTAPPNADKSPKNNNSTSWFVPIVIIPIPNKAPKIVSNILNVIGSDKKNRLINMAYMGDVLKINKAFATFVNSIDITKRIFPNAKEITKIIPLRPGDFTNETVCLL